MKHREFEAVADWDYHRRASPDQARNVVTLRQAPAEYGRRAASQPLPSTVRPPVALSKASDMEPARRRSWIENLVWDFGIAGQSLAFGSIADIGAPQSAPSPTDMRRTTRGRWTRRFAAAVARRYRALMREIAVRRAIQDLHRLDAATLRDVGIHDRMMIETFVRGGRDL